MGFLKYKADKIFDGFRFHENMVLVTAESGTVIELVAEPDAGDDILKYDGILSPGFINCHGHLELSHMKGKIPRSTGLVDFVYKVVTERHHPETEILAAIENAEDEMLRNGIVAAGDICNNTLSLSQKSKGRIYYHNFIEASGFDPSMSEERFTRSLDIFRQYAANYALPVESNSIVPHAPYSVSEELWNRIIYFPGNHLFSMHNQEIASENEWFIDKKGEMGLLYEKMEIDSSHFSAAGRSSLQAVLPKFLANQKILLVHNVFTSEDDIAFSKTVDADVYWCFCPNANKYISDRLPPIEQFINHDCKMVLGTDSLASNDELNILSEIKIIRQNFPSVSLETILQWATSNGAIALEMEALLGTFKKGKRPGILLLNEEELSVKRLL
jgi:aminodeoxyfutalosine deaminase